MPKLFDKLFAFNDWGIAFRPINAGTPLPIGKELCRYMTVKIPKWHYYADPFLFANEGDLYLFAEHMDRKRGIGTIAVAKYDEEKKRFFGFHDVIVNTFHLSYPNVFSHNGNIYMIPESNACGKLLLYRADEFPDKWTIDRVLSEGVKLVDSSLVPKDENSFYLFSHDYEHPEQRVLFLLDMKAKEIKRLTDKEPMITIGRGGGNVMKVGSEWVRPIQDCSANYGERIKLYNVTITSRDFSEEYIGTVDPHNICLANRIRKPDRVHTINRCNGYEVIDYLMKTYYRDKPIMKFLRKVQKKK